MCSTCAVVLASQLRVSEVLQRIISGTDVTKNVNKNNATHAVLFEAINLTIHLGSQVRASVHGSTQGGYLAMCAHSLPDHFHTRPDENKCDLTL